MLIRVSIRVFIYFNCYPCPCLFGYIFFELTKYIFEWGLEWGITNSSCVKFSTRNLIEKNKIKSESGYLSTKQSVEHCHKQVYFIFLAKYPNFWLIWHWYSASGGAAWSTKTASPLPAPPPHHHFNNNLTIYEPSASIIVNNKKRKQSNLCYSISV